MSFISIPEKIKDSISGTLIGCFIGLLLPTIIGTFLGGTVMCYMIQLMESQHNPKLVMLGCFTGLIIGGAVNLIIYPIFVVIMILFGAVGLGLALFTQNQDFPSDLE